MLLSRQARYTGLIDGLEFAEGELADAILALQALVQADVQAGEGQGLVGQALVPYYRQILPVFNIFKNFNTN